MADGDRADFDPLYHPRAVDRENRVQPPSSRVPGPACFYSTALWLRAAFADLRYDIHHAVADGDLVAVNTTMNGRHVAPWAVYTGDGAVDNPIPLVPNRRRPDHRALGEPRRSRDGQATRVDPADAGLPVQDGPGEAARQVRLAYAMANSSNQRSSTNPPKRSVEQRDTLYRAAVPAVAVVWRVPPGATDAAHSGGSASESAAWRRRTSQPTRPVSTMFRHSTVTHVPVGHPLGSP